MNPKNNKSDANPVNLFSILSIFLGSKKIHL